MQPVARNTIRFGGLIDRLTTRLGIPHSGIQATVLMTLVVVSSISAIAFDELLLLGVPLLLIGLYFAISDFRNVFFLLWASIPVSTEVVLDSGFGTDFPDEPLMILLFGMGTIILMTRLPRLSLKLLFHPISVLLLFHLAWIALTAITAGNVLIATKFLLAKTWYIMVFFVLSYYFIRTEKDALRWFKWVLVAVLLTVTIIMFRHAMVGFTFDSINSVLNPFYRNHVNYALMLGVFVPFVWFFRKSLPGKYTGIALCGFLLIAIYFAYTRAAYIGLATGLAGLFIVHFKLTRYAIVASVIVAGIFLYEMADDNRYIDFAPEYEKTISHYNFDDLLEATYSLEDISTMERFYRWIAGFYMIRDKPLTGFGPGNFYTYYKSYTDENFVTYVSDNPERSGMHNYFLMLSVEQGLPGMLIFVLLLVVTLLKAEWLYHRLEDSFARKMLAACICALFFMLFALLLNDMIETDKIGSFFFFTLAMIVTLEFRFVKPLNHGTSPSRLN